MMMQLPKHIAETTILPILRDETVVAAMTPKPAHISKGNLNCRPCARRDPYRVIFVVGKKVVPP